MRTFDSPSRVRRPGPSGPASTACRVIPEQFHLTRAHAGSFHVRPGRFLIARRDVSRSPACRAASPACVSLPFRAAHQIATMTSSRCTGRTISSDSVPIIRHQPDTVRIDRVSALAQLSAVALRVIGTSITTVKPAIDRAAPRQVGVARPTRRRVSSRGKPRSGRATCLGRAPTAR